MGLPCGTATALPPSLRVVSFLGSGSHWPRAHTLWHPAGRMARALLDSDVFRLHRQTCSPMLGTVTLDFRQSRAATAEKPPLPPRSLSSTLVL